MAFAEDPAEYLSTDDFAVDATYDGATPVKVIVDNSYLEQLGIAGARVAAIGAAADFPAGCVGKTLAINGTTYFIRGREPIDDGVFVVLPLRA